MAQDIAAAKPDERYMQTVGYKRNNPGNLMVQGIAYSGKANIQEKTGPVAFITMAKGLRALAMDVKMKGKRFTTVTQILTEYAPSSENDTKGYIAYVSKKIGKGATDPLTFDDKTYIALMQSIIAMEIGYGTCPFTETELQTAVTAAKTSE